MHKMTQDEIELDDNALHLAVRLGDSEATKQALENGYDPDSIGLFEWSALHEASFNGNHEIIEILLKYGANPNKVDITSSNTALHYACSENYALCLSALLQKGGDVSIQNRNGETCSQLATSPECLKVLVDNGCGPKATCTTKPLLKSSQKAMVVKKGKKELIKHSFSNSFERSQATAEETGVEQLSNMSRQSSSASFDSGLSSPTAQTLAGKLAWGDNRDSHLHLPSSPTRSQGSSYGSLTSLGSSSCSAVDDSAGEFVLSFRYNSKKQEFKVCVWQILLTSLISASQMPKYPENLESSCWVKVFAQGTRLQLQSVYDRVQSYNVIGSSVYLYLKCTIIPSDAYQANPAMKRKSEVLRLDPGEQPLTESQSDVSSCWLEREAKIEFKNSMTLEYQDIDKHLVSSSTLQISLCVRPKRSLIMNKPKPNLSDPVLATKEFEMKEAVKRIMKESYNAERHDVLGITRQAFRLDNVVSEKHSYSNSSYNSDPNVRISMSSLVVPDVDRSASDGELLREAVSSETARSAESASSLKSVRIHSVSSNPQVRVHVHPMIDSSTSLPQVEIHKQASNEKEKIKLPMPSLENDVYNQFKYRTRGAAQRGRERSAAHKTRNKLKANGKLLLASANNVLQPNTTVVQAIDDEERSVGSPSEEAVDDTGTPDRHLYTCARANSSSSFTEVDESPSPSRRKRVNAHKTGSRTAARQLSFPHRPDRNVDKKTKIWTLQVDPLDAQVDMTTPYIPPQRERDDIQHERYELSHITSTPRVDRVSRPSTSRNRHHRTHNQRNNTQRESALRNFVYDESQFCSKDDTFSSDNPCYISDGDARA